MKNPFQLLSVTDAADVLCVSVHTMRQMIWRRDIAHVKVGGRVFVKFDDLEDYVNRQTILALPPTQKEPDQYVDSMGEIKNVM